MTRPTLAQRWAGWLEEWRHRMRLAFTRRCPLHPSTPLERNVWCFLCAREEEQKRASLRERLRAGRLGD